MHKNILITGAAGFIGFHTALSCVKAKDTVIGYDNFNDYYDVKLKRDRAKLLSASNVEIIEGDICDSQKLGTLIKERDITHVVHLAAQAGVRYSLTHPQSYVKSNLEGFVTLLEVCRQYPTVQVIYASSSSVYGTNTKIPFSIEDRTDHQASLYGATKKANELFASTYHHLFKMPLTGLRFFTVYGPWGRPDMAYSLFTDAILKDKPIEVYNFGKMKRDFTYIDDIVNGIQAALNHNGCGEVFNLGHHEPVELLEFIETLEEFLGKKAIKVLKEMQPGDVVETFADIRESTKSLNFMPKVSLREGLAEFVKWYKNYYNI